MKNKIDLSGYLPSLTIILELLYKKGYAKGRRDAIKEMKKKEVVDEARRFN
jgi:hypothetical protein|tara:strand:- start:8 stop:160 length:153 start_codon:yes stop_codon:yes gene_type:complete